MSNPRVVEMRRRAWEMARLALKARDREAAEKIIEEFTKGRISGREALEKLKALAEAGGSPS
jgi:hypothetical protein